MLPQAKNKDYLIQPDEFEWIAKFLYERTGISLGDGKQALVMGRLDKRLRSRGLLRYGDYFKLLGTVGYEDETIVAINLLTTNETYFFREPRHFDFVRDHVCKSNTHGKPLRIWSAASSSGEEAYTLAMTLAEYGRTSRWEILGSDVSTSVLETARRALYPLSAAEKIPRHLLLKYCLKGREEFEDFFLIAKELREKVEFRQINLVQNFPDIGKFDVIFLRNVMIYFDQDTKSKIIRKMEQYIKPGGFFIVSHSETINGISGKLKLITPSIYRLE